MTTMASNQAPAGHEPPGGGPPRHARRWWYLGGALAAVALVAVVLAVLLIGGDGTDPVASTTTAPTTTVPSTTTPTTAPPPAPSTDRSSAMWPFPASATRFTEPVEAARAFATTFLGFDAPVVGALLAGDGRSGEVEIRPAATGPVTTVLVRQLTGTDDWSVLGAVTAGIELTEPATLSAVRSPVVVRGEALAFEGNVEVEVRQDGAIEALGAGFVTGGGDQMRPFEGRIDFTEPSEPYGALVLRTRSAENGQVWEAAAVRVRFLVRAEALSCRDHQPPGAQPGAGEMAVTIYLSCDAGTSGALVPMPVERVVPRSSGVLGASLRALLAGPTAEESNIGFRSWFSDATADMLRGVNLVDGHAIVDLGDLRTVIQNASTSAGSQLLLGQLDATVFQFPSVTTTEYRIDGSCETFTEWVQIGGCDPRTRP